MYIITFYSFKGGVGRTMALVNTAAELARRGRKVLLVDFDLEAPGLSTYDLLAPKKPHPGIVEFVTEFRDTRRAPLVTDFLYEVKKDKRIAKKGGRLWVMPAGRDRDAEYRRKLNGLNWRTLYEHDEGFLLFEDTRLQWEHELHPDYVLIDARTGHTDIEGICTRQLADAVAVVFYPNEQNLAGLRQVVRTIRDEETSGLKKKITLHFVTSNVPDLDDEDRHLQRHLRRFRVDLEILNTPLLTIHRAETLEMLNQPIFVLERPRSRLAREYRSLVRALQEKNSKDYEGFLRFLHEIRKSQSQLLDQSSYDQRFQRKGRRVSPSVIARVNQGTGEFLEKPAVFWLSALYFQSQGEPQRALKCYDWLLKLRPTRGEALFRRALCRRQLRDDAGAAADLLDYLREYGAQVPVYLPSPALDEKARGVFDISEADWDREVTKAAQIKRIKLGQRRNRRACFELLKMYPDQFLKALDLPAVAVGLGGASSHNPSFWLFSVVEYLIRERRFQDAIGYLSGKVNDLISREKAKELRGWSLVLLPLLNPYRDFFLAIARWGKDGAPDRDECRKALGTFVSFATAEAEANCLGTTGFQALSLLHWGAGEAEAAIAELNRSLEELEIEGLDEGISYWTFDESTPDQYRRDCEDLRRMIHGEPIRPAFLGPP